jgi:LysR family transcriptional activator of dmlA
VENDPQLNDLRLFCLVVRRSSFVGAARELGASQTWLSKRVAQLETTLGVKLLVRTTRRVNITDEGRKVFDWAQRILEGVEDMRADLGRQAGEPRGPLRIASSAGLGRQILAPALSRMKARFPAVDVWLELMDRRVDLIGEGFHLDIRAGDVDESSLIAHPLATSARILCASPAYIARHGMPASPSELAAHDCVLLRERAEPFGTWRLVGPRGPENVKVGGTLASNDIDVLLRWVHDGHGIVMSADWLFRDGLTGGRLVRVLPEWSQPASIYAAATTRSTQSAKVRLFLEYLREEVAPKFQADDLGKSCAVS